MVQGACSAECLYLRCISDGLLSDFHTVGTLKNAAVSDQLHKITVPVLAVYGKYDELCTFLAFQSTKLSWS